MNLKEYLSITPEISAAIRDGKPVVALESTILSHGMPYPDNLAFAAEVERIVRAEGAVPATMAIIDGVLKVGLTQDELELMCKGEGVAKVSRRDLPIMVAEKRTGATTVASTMILASLAGIRVFATGGIGGVHRGAQETFDISADLEELANTSVMVVCAGAKSILDLGLTLEYLETHGVTVIGYGTSELPAFYTRKSGFGVDYELDTPEQLAKAFHVKRELGLRGGLLVTNPIPEEYSMDKEVIDKAIAEAVEDAKKDGIHGKATTPYLLAKIKDLTGGDSLDSNIQLVFNNARLGAAAAVELSKVRYFVIYLAAINLITFCVYGADKRRAKIQGARRVPEKTLFALALLLGSAGALFAMRVFHHKTRHWYFRFGIPAILLCQIAAGVYVYVRFFAA